MKPAFAAILLALAGCGFASPAAAQDAWHNHWSPGGVGSFDLPCDTDTLERMESEEGILAMCETDALLYGAASVPVAVMAPDDATAEERAAYTFDELAAEAAADENTIDFLAVEYGPYAGFYGAAAAPEPFQRSLMLDLGNGEMMILIALSDTATEADAEAAELRKLADRYLSSFKLTPQ